MRRIRLILALSGCLICFLAAALETKIEPVGPCSRKTGLAITEIMYHPAARFDGKKIRFVELYNSNPYSEDISGFQFDGYIESVIPAGTVIPGGGFLVVADRPADIQFVYGITNVIGTLGFKPEETRTLIRMRNKEGAVLLEVPFPDPVYHPNPILIAADQGGHSLVLTRPSYGEGNWQAWGISDLIGGSPGRADMPGVERLRPIVINEFLTSRGTQNVDFVELYNHSNEAIDVSGAYLSDSATSLKKFRFPSNSIAPARGCIAVGQPQLLFALSAEGEAIFLMNSNATRIVDALPFGAQRNLISTGRYPDGNANLYPMASPTPGTNNSAPLVPDIVINEIMFDPIHGGLDEYIELFNRSTNTISLGGWKLGGGIEFTFPWIASLAPNGYVVAANDLATLSAHHPGILNCTNAFGNLGGGLHNSGDQITLQIPDVKGTNNNGEVEYRYPIVDEVEFGAGGRWGQAGPAPTIEGGGSSLELVDPRSNRRLAPNWAQSDETTKSQWSTVEATGLLDLGQTFSNSPIDQLDVMLLGGGECLLDDVEVFVEPGGSQRSAGPTINLVANPNFENGLSGWVPQGNHVRSGLELSEGFQSQRSLHIRSTGRGDLGANRIRADLSSPLQPGQTATIRAKVRWLSGWPEILLRVRGNYLEAVARLDVPTNLGTPGRPNSRARSNAGPAIYEVSHNPVLPGANEPVRVTARVDDPDGIAAVTLHYRLDPNTSFNIAVMNDSGTNGDLVANDGMFTGTIAGQPTGSLVAFYIQSTDSHTNVATTRFPADAPAHECLVRFGETNSNSRFGTYRFWLTQNTVNTWSNREVLSNELLDGTFVYGDFRAVYNMGGRYAGSPYHQDFDSPVGKPCHYSFDLPKDDQVLGTDSFNKIHAPGNAPFDDPTIQTEQTAYWMARQIGLPWNYKRYVNFFVNGVRRGTLMEDTQVPGNDRLLQISPMIRMASSTSCSRGTNSTIPLPAK